MEKELYPNTTGHLHTVHRYTTDKGTEQMTHSAGASSLSFSALCYTARACALWRSVRGVLSCSEPQLWEKKYPASTWCAVSCPSEPPVAMYPLLRVSIREGGARFFLQTLLIDKVLSKGCNCKMLLVLIVLSSSSLGAWKCVPQNVQCSGQCCTVST